METIKRFLNFLRKNSALLACLLAALVLNIAIEWMDRLSLSAVWALFTAHPLAFLENVLIIALCLSVCLLARRKWFFGVLIGAVWAALGIANLYVLSYRVSPLSAIDFAILQLDWSFIGIYMSVPVFILLVIAVLLLLFGLILLFRKSPKSPVRPRRAVISLCALLLAVAVVPELPFAAGFGGNAYTDVIHLTEEYGFAYTFTRSLIDFGIDRPEDYSARRVRAIAQDVLQTETAEPEETPNIIFLQLESFFDVTYLSDIEFSEDPVPYFRGLKENGPSGFFTAPSVGAGTANTEFEVITQMNVHDFGTGEYPYKTILQDSTCESIAYNLKELGYGTHVVHNNTATFYDRDKVFPKLGFDSFTTIEYMNDVAYNEIGWAKDEVLVGEILDVLAGTDAPDLVYAISVQPHGAYPDICGNPAIRVLSGVEDEARRGQIEYYATQIHEVDAFLCALTQCLERLDEPTVLVVYGDHLPGFEIEESELGAGTLYTTEYAVWSNCGVVGGDLDVQAYQLASHIFGLLGINNGTLTKFHQMNDWHGAYETELLTLQYDMLYGDRVVYQGENPFEETTMRFGTKDIVLQSAAIRGDTLTAHGEHFTPYSVLYLNGDPQDTQFVSETEIACTVGSLPDDARVSVRQVAEDGTELSCARVNWTDG
ncbi:MAG: LTA synthase family protein [Hominenteromicrobium sp.]